MQLTLDFEGPFAFGSREEAFVRKYEAATVFKGSIGIYHILGSLVDHVKIKPLGCVTLQ